MPLSCETFIKPNRAAVAWIVVQDRGVEARDWRHSLNGSECHPGFGVCPERTYIVTEDRSREKSWAAFREALVYAVAQIQAADKPELFLAMHGHGDVSGTLATHEHFESPNTWNFPAAEIRDAVVGEIMRYPELSGKVRLNICRESCSAFSAFDALAASPVPTQFIGSSIHGQDVSSGELLRLFEKLMPIASEIYGHAPDVAELGKLQALLYPRPLNLGEQESPIAANNYAQPNEFTTQQLLTLVARASEADSKAMVLRRLMTVAPEALQLWTQTHVQSADPIERDFAQVLAKASVLSAVVLAPFALAPQDLLNTAIELERLNQIAINEDTRLAEALEQPRVPRRYVSLLDILLVAAYRTAWDPRMHDHDATYFANQYLAARRITPTRPLRKAALGKAFTALFRRLGRGKKAELPDQAFYNRLFALQFLSPVFTDWGDLMDDVLRRCVQADAAVEDLEPIEWIAVPKLPEVEREPNLPK